MRISSKYFKINKLVILVLFISSCNNSKTSSNPTTEETFEFLVQMIDNKDVKFMDGMIYTNVEFKVKNLETCEVQYSYTFEGRHFIKSINFIDSKEAYLEISPEDNGYFSDYIRVQFKKESVKNEGYEIHGEKLDLASPWLSDIKIWVNKGEGDKILKGVRHIIERCAENDKTNLFE